MVRRRTLITLLAMWPALLAATFAQAAEDVLGVIPERALGFVLVNRLAETDAKIQSLGQQMQLPVPSPLEMFKTAAGVPEGLDEKGSAAIVVMPGKDASKQPVAVLNFVPVTDYRQFIEQLKPNNASAAIVEVQVRGRSFLVGNRGGYAVVAEPRYRDALEKALGAPRRTPREVTPLREWLAEGDFAGVVTRRGVELLCAKGQEALQDVKRSLAALPEDKRKGMEAAVGVFTVYEKMLKAAGEEISGYAFALEADENGALHLTERMRFTSGGRAAKMLSQVKPPEGDLLAGLPGGPFVFALGGTLPESLGECLMQFSAEVMKAAPGLYGLNNQQVDKLVEISTQSMKGLRGMSMMMGVGKPGDPIYSDIAVVETVDHAEAFMANYKKTLEVMNQLVKEAGESMLTITKLEDVEIGGVPALKLTMKIPMAPGAVKMPNYEEVMEKLFGPGGKIVAFVAVADDHTIVSAYPRRRLLRESLKVVDGTRPGLVGDPQVAKTAAMLPSGALCVGYVSPKGTIDFINRVIPAMTPEGKSPLRLPDFPPTPPIGFAVKAAPGELRSHTVVPAAVVKAVGGFVAELKKLEKKDAGAASPEDK